MLNFWASWLVVNIKGKLIWYFLFWCDEILAFFFLITSVIAVLYILLLVIGICNVCSFSCKTVFYWWKILIHFFILLLIITLVHSLLSLIRNNLPVYLASLLPKWFVDLCAFFVICQGNLFYTMVVQLPTVAHENALDARLWPILSLCSTGFSRLCKGRLSTVWPPVLISILAFYMIDVFNIKKCL